MFQTGADSKVSLRHFLHELISALDWPPRAGGDGMSAVDSLLRDVALSPSFGNAGSVHFPASLHSSPLALLWMCNASLLPSPKTLSIQVTGLDLHC